MPNIEPDVYGKKAYREERDARMFLQYTEKKMTVHEIATRWGTPWNTVRKALERESIRRGVEVDFQENMIYKRRNRGNG